MADSRRGFVPEDEKEFGEAGCRLLRKAQKDLLYLLEQGYPIKGASVFVGNHYMLSERQRLAVVRSSTDYDSLKTRKGKLLKGDISGSVVCLDGLNVIIALEVALSHGTLIRGMDDAVRDLAGLRGTYRLIAVTDEAIRMIGDKLSKLQIRKAVFYLDAPVSNSGRLKQRIQELLKDHPFEVTVELTENADVLLELQDHVITSDSIILNRCTSWYNLVSEIIRDKLPDVKVIDLSNPNAK